MKLTLHLINVASRDVPGLDAGKPPGQMARLAQEAERIRRQAEGDAERILRELSSKRASITPEVVEVLESILNTADRQIAERQSSGRGLLTPELAVVMAYTKNADVTDILLTDLADDPALDADLVGYFPGPLRERFPDAIRNHRLRRQHPERPRHQRDRHHRRLLRRRPRHDP